MQVSFDPLLPGLEHQSAPLVLLWAAEGGPGVQRQRAEEGSVRSGRALWPAGPDKLALIEWTTGRSGLPLLRDALAWFECQVVGEHPAGDHMLVLGKVIDGKLLDSEAEPMSYRQTGAMDGASELSPDVFGES